MRGGVNPSDRWLVNRSGQSRLVVCALMSDFPTLSCLYAAFALPACCLFSNKAGLLAVTNKRRTWFAMCGEYMMERVRKKRDGECEPGRGKGWQQVVSLAVNEQYRSHCVS